MAEVVLSVVAKLAEYLVDLTLRQVPYLFCVDKITKNVKNKKEELVSKQGRVQECIEEAINKTERIADEVNKWKNEVENLIVEVENLEQELRASHGCFERWLPTWRRYCLCKKLAKRTQRMIELNIKSDQFNPFSHPVIIQDIEYHSSKSFVCFKSTNMASDQLWEALQDDGSFIIGLFGMGGSGKTTLVKKVGKEAKESKHFDRVVFTTISQTLNIRKIQGEIADLLGLKLDEESEIGRARRIALRLQSGERILIILDDVWAKLNLEDIGIPFDGNHQIFCKVILTTRRSEVCALMDCQRKIPLHLLTEDEGWILFQNHANVDEGPREVMAREIAKECKGLPIAIEVVGTCLKGKGLDDMNVVLHRLRHSRPVNVDDGVRDAFACLELSYDYLRIPEAKSLFLMCAMFPEDHSIIIEDILRYGVGKGLCKDANSLEIARSQVRVAINSLIDSSLLMYSENFRRQECLTMHDMVRDVALWIASKEDHTIMVNLAKELNEMFGDEAIKDCCVVSSWYNKKEVDQFSCQLDAPKLEVLLLNSETPLDFSHASFEGIKGLKVLAIKSLMGSLPQSISWLSNLRTLQLRGWELDDISSVARLTRLEILDLRDSKFRKLPNGIEKLNKLKLLDLLRCKMDECCYKVVGRCSQLEELYVSRYFYQLKNINCYECLVDAAAFPKLRRYILEMGQFGSYLYLTNIGTRVLHLGELNISTSSEIIKDLAQRAVAMEFYKLQGGCKSFIPDMIQAVGGMNELTKLKLECCSDIECLTNKIDLHEDAIIPSLVELELKSLYNLKQLCHGPPLLSLFQNLERLDIINCYKLHSLFPAHCNLGNLQNLTILNCPMLTSLLPVSVTCTLLSLRHLKVQGCSELRHIIEGEDGAEAWERAGEEPSIFDQNQNRIVFPHLTELELNDLPNLLRICSESYHLRWPSLKQVCWANCPKLITSCQSFMVGSESWLPSPNKELHALNSHKLRDEESKPLVAVSHIESVELRYCGVSYIFHCQTKIEVQNRTTSCGSNLIIQIPRFQYLKNLVAYDCAKLKFVFSAGICQNLPELSYVTIYNCNELVEIFQECEETHTNLHKAQACLPKLQEISIVGCKKLRTIFSAGICQNLPELTSLDISSCEKLQEIFVENEETQSNVSKAQAYLPKLQSLKIWWCNKLRIIFSMMISVATSILPQLSTLSISNAAQLEEIFRCRNIEEHANNSEKEIMFPNLKDITLEKLPRLANVCHGFKLRIAEFCTVQVHECPNFVPMLGARTHWSPERLVRKFVLKCSQLSNDEALSLPLSILNSRELDIHESSRVHDMFRVIGDDDQPQASMDTKMLGSEHQMLNGVIPTQVLSFHYLHSLEVIKCERLKFLFSMSTILHNSLPKLTCLTLSDCAELEEIIADNEAPQNISDAHVCFPQLRMLEVKGCNKLKKLFSTTMATIFPELHSLRIIEAAQLEEIIGQTRERNKEEQERFPKLAKLIVHRCNKLKCLFSLSSNGDLALLQHLEIIRCSQLEQVFSCEFEIHEGGLNSNVLPELIELTLHELPNLTDICAGFPCHLQFPSLLSCLIKVCPKFSKATFAALDLHNSLPGHQGSQEDFQESDDYNTAVGFLDMTKKEHMIF